MNTIKYFALGGQDEKGKYAAVLELDRDIYIINTGIGMDITNQFGIRKVIPDLQFIEENKARIKGIFLGTLRNVNIGALPFFLEILENVPVYTSKVGETIINAWFSRKSRSESFNKTNKRDIQVVKPGFTNTVGEHQVTAFQIFNSLPDSYGWIFHTNQGAIVHIDEFMICNEPIRGFHNQIYRLPQMVQNKVLALFVGGQNVTQNLGFASPKFNTYAFLKKQIANTQERTIVACYDYDFLTVLNIINIAKTYQLKLAIYSGTLTKLFVQLVRMGYISSKNLQFINSNKDINYDPNSIILITGNDDRLYYKMHKIITGQDQNIKFVSQDLFLLATVTRPGLELKEAKLLDEISRNDIKTSKLSREISLPVAGCEDQKLLANLLQPRYVFVIDCYYKEFVAYDTAVSGIIPTNNIKFLYNGEVASFTNGVLNKIKQLKVSERYVDSFGVVDIGTSILSERQSMYQYGLVAISTVYDKTNHQFAQPLITIRGLLTSDHFKYEEIIEMIKKVCKNEFEKALGLTKTGMMNFKELKLQLKRMIVRVLERKIQKKPLILVSLNSY